jgi:hypothetical protein
MIKNNMIEIHYIGSKKELELYKKRYWKNTRYHKYYVTSPLSFPCIAIETSETLGELGTVSTIENYVYPSDFNL